MRKLAAQIRTNLTLLAEAYDKRLKKVSDYDQMADSLRLEAARNALLVIASGLESRDAEMFTQFVKAMANERIFQGFEIDSVQQALSILVDLLQPGLVDVETANFLWRTMVEVHMALSKMAMDRVRTAERQVTYLADNLAVGIFIHQDGILRYAGREGVHLLGYTHPDELVGRSVFDFVHLEDREWIANIAQRRVLGDPVPDQYQARLIRQDGSVFDARIYSTLTEYEGQPATQAVFVDVSERKGEAESIRQSRQSLQTIIDSMPFGVIIVGRDKRIRHANQSALLSMGYGSEAEVLGRICRETMCPAESDSCPILDLGQRLDRSERILVTRNGRHIPILKSAVPITLGGEEVLLEAFVDVTERKRLEHQIQQSLELQGRQVQISTEVAQEIAATPVLSDLYQKVVTLVKEQFGYYHAQLFLIDEAHDRLVTVAGYGDVGRQLVKQRHFIPMGKGVVGRAGATGQAILSPDVTKEPEWLHHPLLPHTQGELAVPIVLRRSRDSTRPLGEAREVQGSQSVGRVLGVLDVQSDRAAALTGDDRILLEGLCGQIAVAMESTRLRQETQEYLQELEHLTRAMSREGWESFWDRSGSVGYLFDQGGVVPVDHAWTSADGGPEDLGALGSNVSDAESLAMAPLKVRGGELIGVLGVQDDPDNPLSQEELQLLEMVSEQVAQALEGARLFDEEQRARTLLGMRVDELDCLNDIGRKIDQSPPIPEFLQWVTERIPSAMQHPDLCRSAIELNGLVYGVPEAFELPCQIVESVRIGTVSEGKLCIAYSEQQEFLDEEVALLGDIARRVGGYVENRRLLEETQRRLQELTMLSDVSRNLAGAPLQQQEIANIVARQFVEVMGVPEASVSLMEPGNDILRTLADIYRDPVDKEGRHRGKEGFVLADYPATVRVMETLEPLVVQAGKPGSDPAELAYMREAGTETLVIIPLSVKGQAIGVVELEAWDELQITSEELNLAVTLANQAAVALENARLLAESQMQAEEQAILNEMARALTACQDVESVLTEAYRGVTRLMGDTNFYVTFYDPQAYEATLAMTILDGQVEWPRTTQPVGDLGFTEWLITTRQPLLIHDRVRERAVELGLQAGGPLDPIAAFGTDAFGGRLSESQEVASWLGVPMQIRDEVFGTMVALSYTTPQAYTAHSQALLTAVANQTAIALENVRLLESTQHALAEVQATHRSYLRRAWQDHLRQKEMLERSAFLYDQLGPVEPEGAVPVPDLWRPEIEHAVVERGPALVQERGDQERAGLAVPITLRGQILGVIGVEAPGGDRHWTEDEIALVEAIGEQLGQAVESARLFADTQRTAERERLIGEITAKIRASTDMRTILEATAEELGQVLGTSRVRARLTLAEQQGDPSGTPPPSHTSQSVESPEDGPEQAHEEYG